MPTDPASLCEPTSCIIVAYTSRADRSHRSISDQTDPGSARAVDRRGLRCVFHRRRSLHSQDFQHDASGKVTGASSAERGKLGRQPKARKKDRGMCQDSPRFTTGRAATAQAERLVRTPANRQGWYGLPRREYPGSVRGIDEPQGCENPPFF
jgi:hypothetical protein